MFSIKLKQKYPLYMLGFLGILIGIIEVYTAFFPKPFYLNTTRSEPQGIYKVVADALPSNLQIGDYVVIDVPDNMQPIIYGRGYAPSGAPLIKQIGAMPDDEYMIDTTGLYINNTYIGNIAAVDPQGRPLPQVEQGTKRVTKGHILAISTHHPKSFDSRYMGEIELSKVRAKVVPLFTFN